MLIESIGSRELFSTGITHYAKGAQHSLGAGMFFMKHNTTKNEKEMKQQEIKKLQTIGT
jgi:hypothetical protein